MGEGPKTSCEDAIQTQEVAFSTFVLSLATSALVHLGLAEDPSSGQKHVNLPMARHVIDILTMLKEKTTGNLEDDEVRLIDNLLFDLRLKYVEVCRTRTS